MTRYKENSAAFLSGLAEELGKRGYKTTKKDPQTFTRKYPGGRMDVLHVALVRHEDVDFDVVLDCALRVDAAEKLVGELMGSDTKDSTTMGNEVGNLVDGKQRRWTVAAAEDVGRAVGEVVRAAEAIAFPLFERNADPAGALATLRDPVQGPRHSPFDARRYIRTLALAALVGDVAAMEAVAAEGRQRLSAGRDPDAARRFDDFAAKLLQRVKRA
jgi:hypothetical protein